MRVLFDNGAGKKPTGDITPGDPYPGFETDFPSFPIPGTTARTWYLKSGGTLGGRPPKREAINWYTLERQGAAAERLRPAQRRDRRPVGQRLAVAVELEAEPVRHRRLLCLGAAEFEHDGDRRRRGPPLGPLLDQDVDLLATVSEVRPDGKETFVQNGWMRASERKLSTGTNNLFKQPSTLLEPIPSELASDVRLDAEEPVRRGRHPALLRGPRLSRGLTDPRHHRGAQRNPADLVLRPDVPEGTAKVSIAFSTKMPSSPHPPGRARQ